MREVLGQGFVKPTWLKQGAVRGWEREFRPHAPVEIATEMSERMDRFMNERHAADMSGAQRELLGAMCNRGFVQHDSSNPRLIVAQQTRGYKRARGDSI